MNLPKLLECAVCVLMTGFESQPWVNISNSPPLLSPDGHVYIKGLTYEEDFRGCLVSQTLTGESEKIFMGTGVIVSDLHWNESSKKLSFTTHSLNSEKSLGLHTIAPGDKKETLFYSLEEAQKEAQAFDPNAQIEWISSAGIGSDQTLIRLTDNNENTRYLVRKLSTDPGKVILAERKNGVSYIFTPKSNSHGTGVIKVRYGNPGAVGESNPDEILRIEKNKITQLLEDKDSNPQSPYLSFYNTAAINDLGDVVVLAKKENSIVFVFISKDKKNTEISLPEGEYPTPFNFALNNKKQLAVITSNGNTESVYVWDSEKWVLKVKSEDKVKYQEEEVSISKALPSFHGGISLNDSGETVVSSSLVSVKDSSVKFTGVLLLR